MTHKILIADDEPNIVISLEYLMKRDGYEVSVARDGQEALDAHPPRAPAPGAAGRDDAEEERPRGLPGAARRRRARRTRWC